MNVENVKFWMVYGDGAGAPTVKHANYAIAVREAERLARNNPGAEFYVMMPVTKKRKVEVETEVIVDVGDDGIPF